MQTDYFTPAVHACGVIIIYCIQNQVYITELEIEEVKGKREATSCDHNAGTKNSHVTYHTNTIHWYRSEVKRGHNDYCLWRGEWFLLCSEDHWN